VSATHLRTDMKLEVVVIPVSDVDRSKTFYETLGWRLDADIEVVEFRAVQFTSPGSGCSVAFGERMTAAAPGSVHDLYLIVSDIGAARAELIALGVDVSEVFHEAKPAEGKQSISGLRAPLLSLRSTGEEEATVPRFRWRVRYPLY
jgi:catechol 2,3-dioxygenase-like lactoylglutathione lyase family enzyme